MHVRLSFLCQAVIKESFYRTQYSSILSQQQTTGVSRTNEFTATEHTVLPIQSAQNHLLGPPTTLRFA